MIVGASNIDRNRRAIGRRSTDPSSWFSSESGRHLGI